MVKQLEVKPLMIWIKGRIKSNKNVIIVINGGTGSGKTYSAISIAKQCAEELETNFSIEGNLEFNFAELLKKMQRPENLKPGTPFVFEEVGAFGGGASAREWQSQANKFFFSFMQTSRHRNQILIMTCPSFSFLELGARTLVHMQMETAGINFRRKIGYLKPYRIQVNKRTGKFYFKFLRVEHEGRKYKLTKIQCPCPPDSMLAPYEKLKGFYTDALNAEIIANQEKEKEKEKKKEWKCKNCDHEWTPRSKKPSYCPHCQKRQIYILD